MRGDLDADDVLTAARRGLSPTAADAERVRRLTEAALVGVAAPGPAVTKDAPVAPAGSGPSLPLRASPWLGRLAAVGAIAAIAGGVGYRAGWRAARREAIARPPAATLDPAPARATSPSREAVPAAAIVSSPALGTARSPREPARRPAPIAPTASAPASIEEEVRVLRSVERALREHQPGFALALLRELDSSVPNGKLTEERLAVRTIARCASGDVPLGVNLAEDFADQYPNSVYGRRVTESCAATDSASSGDQERRRESQ